MKYILRTFILLFFFNSCAYEYTPPSPNFRGTSAEYDYEIFLQYSQIGCKSLLRIKNNSSKSKSTYIELTAYDGNDTNVDMTNYIIRNHSDGLGFAIFFQFFTMKYYHDIS